MGLSCLWVMLAIGNHPPKKFVVAIKHRDTLCSDLSEYLRNEPDSWLLLLLAGAHRCSRAVSGYCSSLPALLADLSLSALTGDQSTERLKFQTPGKARWLCCLWSSLVPVPVGVLALAIIFFLESGKMPCLYWLLRFYSSAYRKFPRFSCWKHLPVP